MKVFMKKHNDIRNPVSKKSRILHPEVRELLRELVKNNRVLTLPEFNPSLDNVDAKAWLQTADVCFSENPRFGSDLILTLGQTLKGPAAQWLTEVSTPNITWEEFKILFSTEYDHLDTPAAVLTTQLFKTPQENENIVSYATNMFGIVHARIKNMSPEELATAFVLANLSHSNRRVQHLAFTKDIKSRGVMIKELKYLSLGKRSSTSDTALHKPKRFRYSESSSNQIVCRNCHKTGHYARDCFRKRKNFPSSSQQRSSSSSSTVTSSQVKQPIRGACFSCQSTEHYANTCPVRKAKARNQPGDQSKGNFPTRSVNLCEVNPPGSLLHNEPLYRLMTNKSDLIWLPEHETARQKLIAYLTEEPVLMIFDPNLPIELHCDACSLGYAGILIQIVDNKPRVVSYFSKRTTPAESRYHSYEQETLAVVQSIRHFRTYLQYVPFTVVTDCKSLKESYLKQDLNTRVHRWWSFMQAFDFKIVYRPAHKMQHADFLSRHPPLSDNSLSLIVDLSDKFPEKRVDLTSLPDDWLMLAQRQDSEVAEIVSKIENRDIDESIDSSYEIRSGILCRKIQRNNRTRCVPIVPHSYKWSVVNNVHEGVMHLGWEKTLEKVADFYWFKSMSKFVRKFVENCLTCKIAKTPSGKTQVQLHPIPKTVAPWHTVHIDVSGKLSGKNDAKEYLIVMIDSFTKYVLLYHTRKVDTESAVKALKQSISLFAAPSRIIADQGRCFASAEFKQYCNSHQIELHLVATGAARANAQVERVMSVLTNLLTATELGERSWQDAVLDIQLAINCTINRVTRCSPLELMIGKVGRPSSLVVPTAIDTEIVPLEFVRDTATQNMIKSARYDKSRFDRGKAKVKPMSVGDLVFIQNEPRNQMKLSPKFKGPFKIIEVLEHDRYLLKSLTTKRTYKYPHEKLRLAPNLSLNEIDTQSNDLNAESDDERNEESDSLSNAA
ncbi:hypothetical protein M8J77_004056 [Diaphorina citri]|nr:hypothetical protein M8J77_004056 [Diaphorina citri]